MEIEEEKLIFLTAKILSDKGEIVKINSDGRRFISINGKRLVPDLLTLDKKNNIKGIYEVITKVDKARLLKFKEVAETTEFNLIIPYDKQKEIETLLKETKVKIKSLLCFVKKESNKD